MLLCAIDFTFINFANCGGGVGDGDGVGYVLFDCLLLSV